MTDLINREAAIAAANACPDRYCGSWVAERIRALPAVQPQVNETPKTEHDREDALTPDATAIREAARALLNWRDAELQEAINSGNELKSVKIKIEDASAFLARALSLIDKPGKEEALGEMSRLGQEFDAAIFSDVEGLYGEDTTRKEVMPDVRQYQNTAHDTAPAGLSAGGGAGWQPIETAPKDRVVDLWSSRGFRHTDAFWDVCCGEECWTDPNDHGSIEEGGPYTHWRYPPEPPAEGSE